MHHLNYNYTSTHKIKNQKKQTKLLKKNKWSLKIKEMGKFTYMKITHKMMETNRNLNRNFAGEADIADEKKIPTSKKIL